ncbi:MAG: hypothetical protein LBM77_04980 [Spirochaetaceae bacterium]|jgi:predicted small lipoprotein YifL|nr:hypothetical protein [Spirochaetaceae bacterium]
MNKLYRIIIVAFVVLLAVAGCGKSGPTEEQDDDFTYEDLVGTWVNKAKVDNPADVDIFTFTADSFWTVKDEEVMAKIPAGRFTAILEGKMLTLRLPVAGKMAEMEIAMKNGEMTIIAVPFESPLADKQFSRLVGQSHVRYEG